ncbi:hypothetical protein [Gordonia sp. (in: high G+C Gram-positive bacteria)]|uniref:hypothetical protein n=1 Tax=Gordonia sp. (in: high G+C Gram-positive bacteria) TaxID=84139 RepID=UPI003F9E383B
MSQSVDRGSMCQFGDVIQGDTLVLNGSQFGLQNADMYFTVTGVFGEDGKGRHYELMHIGTMYGLYAEDHQQVFRAFPAK